VARLEQKDRELARQIRTATSSIPANLAEGRRRACKDRQHHWRQGLFQRALLASAGCTATILRRGSSAYAPLYAIVAAPCLAVVRSASGRRIARWNRPTAAGSADEVHTTLRVVVAWGKLQQNEVDEALRLLDRVLAMTWRLTH
jgi:hypothetical protein